MKINTINQDFNSPDEYINFLEEQLKNFKLDVYAYDPFASEEKAKNLNVTLTSLEYIFENCQTISNHCANLPETQNILNGDLFKLMKKN